MQPISKEMQGINSLINSSQISLQDLNNQIQNPHMNNNHNPFDPSNSHDDFLQQMLSNLGSSSLLDPNNNNNNNNNNINNNKPMLWGHDHNETTLSNMENNVVGNFPYDENTGLPSKFNNHQITATSPTNNAAAASLLLHHQVLMASGVAGDSGILQIPVTLGGNDVVDGSTFKSPNQSSENSLQPMHNGFAGSLHGTVQGSNQIKHFQPPQGSTNNQATLGSGAVGGTQQGQPRQRVRARRGQATDPHSIAERLRRERIAERMKALQELVPNANKTDKASMLDEIIDYVKFLQVQVKVLSMSRLGGAASVTTLVADMPSQGGGDCIQANGGGALKRNTNGNQTAASTSNSESLTMSEHQVAKLMEEDMGSAMQYLQGKGLCLMPISLATAISTCQTRNNNHFTNGVPNHNGTAAVNLHLTNGEGPSSSTVSVTTVQSAIKDTASISMP